MVRVSGLLCDSFCCLQLWKSAEEGWAKGWRNAEWTGELFFPPSVLTSQCQGSKGSSWPQDTTDFISVQSSTSKCMLFLGIPSAFWLSGIFLLDKQCHIESERSGWMQPSSSPSSPFPWLLSQKINISLHEICFLITLCSAAFLHRFNQTISLSFFMCQNYGWVDSTWINCAKCHSILIKQPGALHRITESLWLEKTFRIVKS